MYQSAEEFDHTQNSNQMYKHEFQLALDELWRTIKVWQTIWYDRQIHKFMQDSRGIVHSMYSQPEYLISSLKKVPSLTPKKSTFVWKLRLPVLVFRGTVTWLLLEQITQISVLIPFLDSKRIQIPGKLTSTHMCFNSYTSIELLWDVQVRPILYHKLQM